MIIDLIDQMSVGSATLYCNRSNLGMKVGITSGCFDTLHYYHLIYLMRCKQFVDVLIVGVDSDRKIRSEKGKLRPIVNERHRLAMVNALKCVDACFILDDLEQFAHVCNLFITNARREENAFVFKNQEWLGKEEDVIVGNTDAQVVIVPDIEELTSTSEMIKKIEKQVAKRKE
jgi:cytidyltransferase-like protein